MKPPCHKCLVKPICRNRLINEIKKYSVGITELLSKNQVVYVLLKRDKYIPNQCLLASDYIKNDNIFSHSKTDKIIKTLKLL